MARPLAIDLCCGLGGWATGLIAAGFEVVGFDIEQLPYPGRLVIQDIRTLTGHRFREARLIVASPPCEEFSRHDQPWTKAKNPPPPDLSLVEACYRIAREAEVPLVLENVRGAAPWLGPPVSRYGRQYLWGDGVPALIPYAPKGPAKKWGWQSARERAIIPKPLADFIASVYHGENEMKGY